MSKQPLRFAVVGSRRGQTFIQACKSQAGDQQIELKAICDNWPQALDIWRDTPGLKLYSDYEQVLADPEIDAVCIATPLPLHASQAIAALNAGKHVMSEVIAAATLEECWALVEAVERTGLTYMMAENYCFSEAVLQVQHMVENGVFGKVSYASGAYLHDCRKLLIEPSGELTWRGKFRNQPLANTYPTHSLGPVARWLGINRGDFFDTTASWQSPSDSARLYAERNFPTHPELHRPGNWIVPDNVRTVLRTEGGALAEIRVDWTSPRPHHMHSYEVQGSKAAFVWPDGSEGPLVWIDGKSPGDPETGIAESWEPLFKYRDEYQHPLWREFSEQAAKAGHGGGDFFVLREFVSAIREQRRPLVDVYDAVTWSSLLPLSATSIAGGNTPVKVPRFERAKA